MVAVYLLPALRWRVETKKPSKGTANASIYIFVIFRRASAAPNGRAWPQARFSPQSRIYRIGMAAANPGISGIFESRAESRLMRRW
jgi:hypothetical protein